MAVLSFFPTFVPCFYPDDKIMDTTTTAHIMKDLDIAFRDVKIAQDGKLKGRPLTELLNEILTT